MRHTLKGPSILNTRHPGLQVLRGMLAVLLAAGLSLPCATCHSRMRLRSLLWRLSW
jgi:hypothetical protein